MFCGRTDIVSKFVAYYGLFTLLAVVDAKGGGGGGGYYGGHYYGRRGGGGGSVNWSIALPILGLLIAFAKNVNAVIFERLANLLTGRSKMSEVRAFFAKFVR